jgi:hypothetical protein
LELGRDTPYLRAALITLMCKDAAGGGKGQDCDQSPGIGAVRIAVDSHAKSWPVQDAANIFWGLPLVGLFSAPAPLATDHGAPIHTPLVLL